MIILNNKIQDDEKNREELLKNIEISKTNYSDGYEIIKILNKSFRN